MSKESARNLQEINLHKGSVVKNRSSIKIQEKIEKPSSFKKKESQSDRNSFTQNSYIGEWMTAFLSLEKSVDHDLFSFPVIDLLLYRRSVLYSIFVGDLIE